MDSSFPFREAEQVFAGAETLTVGGLKMSTDAAFQLTSSRSSSSKKSPGGMSTARPNVI